MDKEQWKDDMINSLKGIRPAEPNPFLLTRIEAAIGARVSEITPRQWRIAFAFSFVLLLVNGWMVLRNNPPSNDNDSGSPYQFDHHEYKLY